MDASLFSSPTVISDNRIENLNGFPTVGRGYSVYSNKLQSMCFEKISKTRPTFDLDYEMTEVNEEFFSKIPVSGKEKYSKANLDQFIRKYYHKEETEKDGKYQLRNIIVNLEIRTYYYALDETQSRLSKNVKDLLEKKQYVAFFNSCGHHYVRAVGSYSTYIALLQYRLKGDKKSDNEFQKKLETGLFNFQGVKKVTKDFQDDADYRALRVFIKGVGLSKGNMVNLVPVDIDQFRLTIQDAVKLMQDPNSGIISSMEIVPWVENPELVTFIGRDLSEGDHQFIRQQRLESNSGIIKEINRISTEQIEQFYKAGMCRRHLYENYIDTESRIKYDSWLGISSTTEKIQSLTELIDQKVIKYDMDKTRFFNMSNENDIDLYISIDEFMRYFAKHPPNEILQANKNYLYGNGPGKPGALDCIDKLYKMGLDQVDYRTIPSCTDAMNYNKQGTNFIDQYCLPKPAKLVFKKEKGESEKDGDERKIDGNKDKKDIKTEDKGAREKPAPRDLKDLIDNRDKEKEDKDKTKKKDDKPKSLEDVIK